MICYCHRNINKKLLTAIHNMINPRAQTPWTHAYSPKLLSEVVGQETGLRDLTEYITRYKQQKRKACIVHGPTGCGKTSAIHAIARQHNLEILEVNASDVRNKEQIDSVIGGATKQRSLFFQEKLILLDEVDGLSGNDDRGGIPALVALIEGSAFPVVCTATNPYEQKLSSLRKVSSLIEFQPLNSDHMFEILKRICVAENITFAEDDLRALARRSGTDVRAAITDLQSLSSSTRRLDHNDLEMAGQREQTETIMNALLRVLKSTDIQIAISAFDNLQEDLDEISLWIDENMPKEYDQPEDLARAYDYLSQADIMKARIRRWQHWRFMVYVSAYLSAGVAVSKSEKYKKFVQYERTKRLLKIWMANQKYFKRKAIAEKIAAVTHTSARRALQDSLPYLQEAFRSGKDKVAIEAMAAEIGLDDEEAQWMRK